MRHLLGFIVTAVAIVLVAAALFLSSVIRYAAHQTLARLGIAATGGNVSIGLDRVEVAHMALSGSDTMSIAATYTLRGLIGGTLKTLEITDLALHGRIAPDGSLTIDSYRANQPKPNADPATPIVVPAEQARIDHAVFRLETPAGPATVTGKGEFGAANGVLHLTGDASATMRDFKVTGRLKFAYTEKGWTVDIDPVRSEQASGTISIHVAARGADFRTTGSATVRFRDFGIAAGGFSAEGVNGAIDFTRLSPLVTEKGQVLTAKRLAFGQVLEDGRFQFALKKNYQLTIDDAHGAFMGGEVALRGQTIDLQSGEQSATVQVAGIDLSQAMTLADLKGLSSSGRLDGTLPLRHKKDTLRIEDGELHATGPGVLKYDSTDASSALQGGQEVTLLREVLKDFHYQKMAISITGEFGGEEEIKMALAGNNPSVYGGKSLELNLNFSGALDSIVRSSVQFYNGPLDAARKPVKNLGGQK